MYLDQSFLAGIGNYLRSEILFVSRVHPARRPMDLGASELERMTRETLRITARSYRTRGITVAPSLERRLRAAAWSFEERRFYVFGREGEHCHECGSKIRRLPVGGRNLFLCTGCQPL